MTHTDGLRRWLARALVNHAASILPAHRALWGEAMHAEVEVLAEEDGPLRWALGCVLASYRERLRDVVTTAGPLLVKVAALPLSLIGLYAVFGGRATDFLRALPGCALTILVGAWVVMAIGRHRGDRGVVAALRAALGGQRHGRLGPGDLEAFLARLAAEMASEEGPSLVRRHLRLPFSRSMFGTHPSLLLDAQALQLMEAGLTLRERGLAGASLAVALAPTMEEIQVERWRPAAVLDAYGDALAWLGLVTTLLGLMKALDQLAQPDIFGPLAGGSLVGVCFGLVCAKGILRPLARRLIRDAEQDMAVYRRIAVALTADGR